MQYHNLKIIGILLVKLKNGAKPSKVLPKRQFFPWLGF